MLGRLASAPADTAFTSVAAPQYAPDGSMIYFRGVQEDGSRGIWRVSPAGGSPTRVVAFDDPAVSVVAGFTVGPDLFYLTIAEYESDIWVMDLDW
jgi:hypothetical protein